MPSVIAIVTGGLIGAAWSNAFGALVGAALAWLLLRVDRQERLIAGLLKTQRVSAPTPAPVRAPEPPAPAAEPEFAATMPPLEVPQPVLAAPPMAPIVPRAATAATAASASRPVRPPRPPPIPRPDPLAPLKAWLFGGNTIVKAGVAILFVGLAFLAKFASEHVQVPVEVRLMGIAGVAIALLVVGWRLRLARPGYAQVLQGGAVAVLYLTLFVAFRFYGVLAVGPVFALMVVVAALAAALAVLQNARALATIGALGCRRRFKSEPPCRLNIEPGVEADFETVGCG